MSSKLPYRFVFSDEIWQLAVANVDEGIRNRVMKNILLVLLHDMIWKLASLEKYLRMTREYIQMARDYCDNEKEQHSQNKHFRTTICDKLPKLGIHPSMLA